MTIGSDVTSGAGGGAPRARRGLHVSIGINRVKATHYAGWPGALRYAESDADAIDELLCARSFTCVARPRGPQATRSAVRQAIGELTRTATAGDLACIYYAGHGSQVPDHNRDELHGEDQTWCLHDDQLIDDEIHVLLGGFVAGVRVLVISDSCMSGTVTKGLTGERSRAAPRDIAEAVYAQNRSVYGSRQATSFLRTRVELLAASDMQQLAFESNGHGCFTRALLDACADAGALTYEQLFASIRQRMRNTEQDPQRYPLGPEASWFDEDTAFVL